MNRIKFDRKECRSESFWVCSSCFSKKGLPLFPFSRHFVSRLYFFYSLSNMIHARLSDSLRYETLHPLFPRLFEYLRTHDFTHAPAERITLDGERLFINVADVEMKTREDQKLEVHRRYIDVHIPLSGVEECGWSPISSLQADSDFPFDEDNDYALYTEAAQSYFVAFPGDFYIMFPEDAHAPIIGDGRIRKLIAKVLTDEQR